MAQCEKCSCGCPCGQTPPPDDTDARALFEAVVNAGFREESWRPSMWAASPNRDKYRALAAWCRRYFGKVQADADAGPRLLQDAYRRGFRESGTMAGYRAQWAAARAWFAAHPEELR